MHIHKPYCTPVLPLVYDDALSYYETICKLIDRINRIYSDIQSIVESVLQEMGLDGAPHFRNVYNVKDYGATGDGKTDDRMSIQKALNAAYDAGGGIVFVPEGHYICSRCIIIGTNCYLIGSGKGTIIECVDHSPYWGTAVGIMGSAAGCCNMTLLYYDYSDIPIVSGAAWGAIGVTNAQYYDAVAQHGSMTRPDYKDIIISDIWTEGYYSLQIEPTEQIENVVYRNIHAPGSIVSVQGGTVYPGTTKHGIAKNVICENVECDYFRILGGKYAKDIFVNGLRTHYIVSTGSNVQITDFTADCSIVSPLDPYIVAASQIPDTSVGIACCYMINDVEYGKTRCSLRNGTITGRALGVPQRGLSYNSDSKYLFENLTIKGFSLRNISGAVNADVLFIGCDAEEVGITNTPTGRSIASQVGPVETDLYPYWTDVYTDIASIYSSDSAAVNLITFANGWRATGRSIAGSATLNETYIAKNGNTVHGNIFAYTSGTLALDQEICTLPFHPLFTIYVCGFCINSNITNNWNTTPAIFRIMPSGKVYLHYNCLQNPGTYNVVSLSYTFTIGDRG